MAESPTFLSNLTFLSNFELELGMKKLELNFIFTLETNQIMAKGKGGQKPGNSQKPKIQKRPGTGRGTFFTFTTTTHAKKGHNISSCD
jgi:hypothetical protein